MAHMVTTENILTVCVAIKDRWTIDEWEQSFHNSFLEMTGEDAVFAHDAHVSMYRAALLFSLVSLRKVADRSRQDSQLAGVSPVLKVSQQRTKHLLDAPSSDIQVHLVASASAISKIHSRASACRTDPAPNTQKIRFATSALID